MGALKRWARRLRIVLGGSRASSRLDDEISFHLEMEARALIDQGMEPEEAHRQALLAFGGVARHKEEARDAMGVRAMEELLADLRLGARDLRQRPVLTAVILLTLGLGLGASSAIFGFVDAVLLRPLPYEDAERVVRVKQMWADTPDGRISPAEHLDYERELSSVSAYGSYAFGALSLSGEGEPVRLSAAFLSHGALPALGVAPILGRMFSEEEDRSGALVALLSHELWRGRFGADEQVIGRGIVLNDTTFQVIGVLPAGFRLPEDLLSGSITDVYSTLGIDPATVSNRGSHFLEGVARLAPGISIQTAASEIETLTARWNVEFGDAYPERMNFRGSAEPMRERVLGGVKPLLITLLGAAGLLLLIVAANVTGLHYAAADSRRHDLAIRSALGAGKGRLIRLLLVESLILAVAGGLLGVGIAAMATDLFLAIDPPDIPRLEQVALGPRVLVFVFGITVATGLAFGLPPALHHTRGELSRWLGEGGTRTTSRSGLRFRRSLVVAELAIGIVVLAGAGLFTRSLSRLLDVDPGFRTDHVLTSRLSLSSRRYPDNTDVTTFYRELTDRLTAHPGTEAVAAVTNLPLATSLGDLNFEIEGRPVPDGAVSPRADWQAVTPGYLEAIGLRLVRGRWIRLSDDETTGGVVVISESTASRYWPNENPIGARFRLGGGAGPGWVSVVGIVRDVTHSGLDDEPRAQMYLPHAQFRSWGNGRAMASMTVVVRTTGDPVAFAPTLRQVLRDLDANLPIAAVATLDEVLSRSVSRPRALAYVLGLFSLLALVLCTIGVYGVMAYSVSERRREFAIRIAVGARDGHLIRSVLRQGAWLIAIGIGVGVPISVALASSIEGLLFRVSPTDPATLLAVAVGLSAVGLAACWLPAVSATRADPLQALRAE
ncbi:MAG: ABC transporter permease [Gemmatimonadales bacterium]